MATQPITRHRDAPEVTSAKRNGHLPKREAAGSIPFIKVLQMAIYFYDRASPLAPQVRKAEIKMLSSAWAAKQGAHLGFCTRGQPKGGEDGHMGTATQGPSLGSPLHHPPAKSIDCLFKGTCVLSFCRNFVRTGCLPPSPHPAYGTYQRIGFKRNTPLGFLFFCLLLCKIDFFHLHFVQMLCA